MKKKIYITQKNKDALLSKANELVNEGASLKRVLQRCRISYRQLLKLSRDPDWVSDMQFKKSYDSPAWCPNALTQLNRAFAVRGHAMGLTVRMLSFLLSRSERTIYRYLETEKSKHEHTET